MCSYRFNPIYVYSELPVNRHLWTDLIGVPTLGNPSERYHKYQDPLQLYQLLLGMWQHYDLVFDPFMGSGTCGLAARHYRMDFWGTEIDPDHYQTACDRLEYKNAALGGASRQATTRYQGEAERPGCAGKPATRFQNVCDGEWTAQVLGGTNARGSDRDNC